MNFSELFNSIRFPKKTQTPVTKPTYQISADEYNALANKVKELVEAGFSDFKYSLLTESEYQQLVTSGQVDNDTTYFTYATPAPSQTATLSDDKQTLTLTGVTLSEDKQTLTLAGTLSTDKQTLTL